MLTIFLSRVHESSVEFANVFDIELWMQNSEDDTDSVYRVATKGGDRRNARTLRLSCIKSTIEHLMHREFHQL